MAKTCKDRRYLMLLSVLLALVGLWGILSAQPTEATNTPGNTITDHALADGATAAAVGCKSDRSSTVYITMRNVTGAETTLTVSFVDDTTNAVVDTLPFPLAAGATVNITQAAGGTPDVDTHLVVSGTAVGDLLGWMSISTQNSALGFDAADVDYCRTYTTLAAAIADE